MTNNVERVFAAIDVMNIYHSGQEQFGKDYRVNFRKLIDLIQSRPICSFQRQCQIVAYTITPHFQIQKDGSLRQTDSRNRGFLKYLSNLGIAVKNRDTYIEKGLRKLLATDWDVGITLDAMKFLPTYDTFSLISGDGDYSLLLEELKSQGKYTEVITFERSASRILCASAHRTSYLTKEQMFHRTAMNGINSEDTS